MKDQIVYWLKQIYFAIMASKKAPIEVTNITALTGDQLDALKPGDVVVKVTGAAKHTYIVSYKGEGTDQGICLTYTAAGYGETVSYDRTADGWVFNSVDVKTYGE